MPTVLSIGNHAAPGSTESSYDHAWERLGWHVEKIQQEEAFRNGPQFILDAAMYTKPWLVTYARTHNDTALGPEWTRLWRRLEDQGAKTASIHLDVFWGIPEREQWIADGDPLFTTGTVFTADGRRTSAEKWEAAGVNHVWLPPAIDERNLLPADFTFEPCEGLPPVVWVGSSNYHANWPWRRTLVDLLRSEYGERLIEWGNGSPLGSNRDNGVLTTLYSADTLVIGDSMFSDQDGRYLSDRMPETLGRGGFLLHPRVDRSLFFDEIHYAPTNLDIRDLRGSIDMWSRAASTVRRLRMKHDAAHIVRMHHTYRHRAETILAHLGLTTAVEA